MRVTRAVNLDRGTAQACRDDMGRYWFSAFKGKEAVHGWVVMTNLPDSRYYKEAVRELAGTPLEYEYKSERDFDSIHHVNLKPLNKPTIVSTTQTLDNMTPEALRDLAARATAAAKKAQAEEDEKDIIPGVGKTWKYDGRLFTVMPAHAVGRVLVSCAEKGGDFRWACCDERFSQLPCPDAWRHWTIRGLYPEPACSNLRPPLCLAVATLALIAAGQMALDP